MSLITEVFLVTTDDDTALGLIEPRTEQMERGPKPMFPCTLDTDFFGFDDTGGSKVSCEEFYVGAFNYLDTAMFKRRLVAAPWTQPWAVIMVEEDGEIITAAGGPKP